MDGAILGSRGEPRRQASNVGGRGTSTSPWGARASQPDGLGPEVGQRSPLWSTGTVQNAPDTHLQRLEFNGVAVAEMALNPRSRPPWPN